MTVGRVRLQAAQGRRAGLPSRLVADAVDLVMIALLAWVILLAVAAVRFMFSGDLDIPGLREPVLRTTSGLVLCTAYLAYGWASAGKTIGKELMGLRVMREDGRPLGTPLAVVRAVLCLLLMPGLLWALVSRRNASIQDLLVGSVVVYDADHRRRPFMARRRAEG